MKEGKRMLLLLRLKKASPLITAVGLSIGIWSFFVIWTVMVFEKSYDFFTIIFGTIVTLVFAGSTTWDAYREWRKIKDESKS